MLHPLSEKLILLCKHSLNSAIYYRNVCYFRSSVFSSYYWYIVGVSPSLANYSLVSHSIRSNFEVPSSHVAPTSDLYSTLAKGRRLMDQNRI